MAPMLMLRVAVLVFVLRLVRMLLGPEFLSWQIALAVNHDVELGGRNPAAVHLRPL